MAAPKTPNVFFHEAAVGLTSPDDRFAVYVFDPVKLRERLVHTVELWSEVPDVAYQWARTNRKQVIKVYDRARRGTRRGIDNAPVVRGESDQATVLTYETPTLLVLTECMQTGPAASAKRAAWQIAGPEWRAAPVNEFDKETGKWRAERVGERS